MTNTKTASERAWEIVTEFKGKFINWEHATPLADAIAAELERQEKLIAALKQEMYFMLEPPNHYSNYELLIAARAARLDLEESES